MEKALGVTMGDPGGVGAEVLLRALARLDRRGWPSLKVFGHGRQLDIVARRFGLPPLQQYPDIELFDTGIEGPFPLGEWTEAAAKAQVSFIAAALDAIEGGEIQGIVTGPIHKRALAACDLPYHGHTEWLEDRAGVDVAMMLAGPLLRTVPVTCHIPLREVASSLTTQAIFRAIELTRRSLRQWFGIPTPKIAVCGLNPHAGDGGLLGHEDEEIVKPAVDRARALGWEASGPLPADTVFFFAYKGQFDAVIAMYHDQALAPLKLLHFDEAVNLTLGLPFVRTSVDHGTAYDIAPHGVARSTSMEEALRLAASIA